MPTLIQPSCQRLPYLEPTASGLTVTVSLFTQIRGRQQDQFGGRKEVQCYCFLKLEFNFQPIAPLAI